MKKVIALKIIKVRYNRKIQKINDKNLKLIDNISF